MRRPEESVERGHPSGSPDARLLALSNAGDDQPAQRGLARGRADDLRVDVFSVGGGAFSSVFIWEMFSY